MFYFKFFSSLNPSFPTGTGYGVQTNPAYGPLHKSCQGNKIEIEATEGSVFTLRHEDENNHIKMELVQAALEWGNERGCENRLIVDMRQGTFDTLWYSMGLRWMSEGFCDGRFCHEVEDANIEFDMLTSMYIEPKPEYMYLPPQAGVVDLVKNGKATQATLSPQALKEQAALTANLKPTESDNDSDQ